nr:hypothetical protein [Tanacetum cinerariifolium]
MVLLYVHAIISEQVVVEDQTLLMRSWDTMKLKLKEKEELNMVAFGRLRVKEAYRYVKKQRLTKGKIREMKNSPVRGIYKKFDEMIEMASIAYPKNETFKKLVVIRNEKLLKAFKPRKICVMLELDNEVQSDEHNNNEQELDENILQNTYGFLVSQPYPNSQPVEMQSTTIEITEDNMVANIEEDVGGSGNAEQMDAEIETQKILTLDEINITLEENMGLNFGNNKDGENHELNMDTIVFKETYTNLDEGEKDGTDQISDSSQNSGKKRLCDFTPPDFYLYLQVIVERSGESVHSFIRQCNTNRNKIVGTNEEVDQRKSADAQVDKDKPAKKKINTRSRDRSI